MVKKLLLISFWLIYGFYPVRAQTLTAYKHPTAESKAFYKEIERIYIDLFSVDSDKSLELADSLYRNAQNPDQEAAALILSSSLLGKEGVHLEAVEYAERALKIAQRSDNHRIQIFAYQNLVRMYAANGFYDPAQTSLKAGLALIPHIKKEEDRLFLEGVMIKANGQLAMKKGDWDTAEQEFKKAIDSFEKVEITSTAIYTIISRTYQLLGQVYFETKRYDEAIDTYRAGQKYIQCTNGLNSLYAGRIYEGFAQVFLVLRQTDSAQVYLQKGAGLANSDLLKDSQYKELIFKGWAEYYRQLNQKDSARYYQKQYQKLVVEREIRSRKTVNEMMNYILKHTDDSDKESHRHLPYVILGIGVIGLMFVIYWWYSRRRLRTPFDVKEHQVMDSAAVKKASPAELSDEVVEDLKKKLAQFEEEERFLSHEMSFPVMAGALDTNTKYLNRFLSAHLSIDYVTYINNKRVEYAIKKLREDPKWRNYKLTYLAKESGFSSYSAFANNFKRLTGSSPSDYIKSLGEED